MKPALYLSGVFLVVGLIVTGAPLASASHWCADTTFSLSPSSAVATRSTSFTVTMANTGVDNTQLSSVEVKFSWEGTWRNAGSGTILAGQTGSFSTAATPPSAGTYAVEIKATGTSSGDWLHETIECTSAGTITATPPPTPGFDGAFVMIALVGVGIAAFRRRIRA